MTDEEAAVIHDIRPETIGSEDEVTTSLEVLARLSAFSEDGRLRDSIAAVRSALHDVLDEL